MAVMHPARDEEVARALGSAPAEDRRLDLEEVLLRHHRAHQLRHPVPEDEDLLHCRAAEVEVAILEAELFVGLGPLNVKRRSRRGVKDLERISANFDRPRLEVRVFFSGQPSGNHAANSDDISRCAAHASSRLELGAHFGLEDALSQAVAVANINEDQAAEVAPGVHPAIEDDRLADVFERQIAAGMSPFEHDRRGFQPSCQGLQNGDSLPAGRGRAP